MYGAENSSDKYVGDPCIIFLGCRPRAPKVKLMQPENCEYDEDMNLSWVELMLTSVKCTFVKYTYTHTWIKWSIEQVKISTSN